MYTPHSKNVDNKEKITSDIESFTPGGNPIDETTGEVKLVRQLKNRHIAMISIGGVIGTGLFLGTATGLKNGGPLGMIRITPYRLWLGYIVMGSICYSVMISLGEMIAYLPIPGGHIKLAERFINPAFSFTMGWNYWYNWTIILPAELSASAVLIGLWSDVNPAVWITVTMVVTVSINFLGAGAYGEAEFIFASIKVITIVGLIILGIVLDLGGGPNHDRIGFRNWKHPGPFNQFAGIQGSEGRFLAWWAVMTQAAFSFIGTEIVAIAAGEAKNPRRNLPRAIQRVYIRICLFYILGTLIIGLLVPYTSPGLDLSDGTAASSPFVIAIERAGIKALPSIINACLLTAAWSAASSDLYTSSRALYGLAQAGNAPKIFLKTSKKGLPWASLVFCSVFALLSYMGVNSGAGKVFGWFANMTSVAGLLTWFGISCTYIRFYQGLKVQGYDRSKLPFVSKLQPYAAWYAASSCILICFTSGWMVFLKGRWATDTFVTNYLPLALFPLLYISARFWTKKPMVNPKDMDFVTNIAEIEAETYDDPPPRNKFEAFWQWLVSDSCPVMVYPP
ncbi:Lysine-specific permease [Termitomyces sp. J132]|nr:Lysine-specific permease [Termitomyces sp. J132]